ncbi:hypothetical protein B0H13DRAFT_2662316 [Mycena leptocephala]|nr:hypothetical protein B0H13DRAFT_2662316 [Mycena leptocephala]
MAPQQFYANLTALHSPVPTSETPVPTPRKRVASNSQPQSPPKRKRGRPAGSTKAKTAAAQRAKPAAKSQPKVAQRKSVKENIPPPETIELSDSDNEIERTDTGKIRHWQPDERTTFYRFLLAFDPVGDKRFVQHQVDPGRVYRRASEILFSGERSAASIKSMWLRSLDAFQWIRAFESFTGNGGGDPDSDDPEAQYPQEETRRSAQIGKITEWEDNGWWDLFNDRLGTSAKVAREVVRNSAASISDIDDNFDEEEGESEGNIHPLLLEESRAINKAATLTPSVPKTPAAIVSEPKHVPSSAFRKQTINSFGNIGDYMKMKMISEEKKTTVLDAKLGLEREKLELDKMKGKVEMARSVFAMDGTTEEVKDAANAFLLSLFK